MEKKKFQIEFDMKGTPVSLLWAYISSASGLKEWFADAVGIESKKFTFYWEHQPQTATLLTHREGQSIRWRWDDEPSRAYFELRIAVDDMTETTTLCVTDFADDGEEDDAKALWQSQVDVLRGLLGC